MLVSSHAVADLEALATRVAVLRDGELVAIDTPDGAARADEDDEARGRGHRAARRGEAAA